MADNQPANNPAPATRPAPQTAFNGVGYYRVTDAQLPDKRRITVTAAAVKGNPSRYNVLDQPALDRNGRPLAPKYAAPKEK